MDAGLVFPALRHRNFRLLWGGLLVSFSGSYMQTAAILWHVSLLAPDERRALALGLVDLVRIGPIIVFSLVSGVAADALDRRKLTLVTQGVMAVLAAIPAVLTFRGQATIGSIYLLAAVSSAAGAFESAGAPGVGAVLSSLVMVRAVDWIEHRGVVLPGSIAVYGAATAAFGLSRAFWLSFGCLAMTGVADTVSMIFRNLIRQAGDARSPARARACVRIAGRCPPSCSPHRRRG